jgi:hypothetical protein
MTRPARRSVLAACVPQRGRARRTTRSAGLLAVALVTALAAAGGTAWANAPNPTSVQVVSESSSAGKLTVTVAGTWTWDKRVPNGPQQDCNDSRIGVGYAVSWGDNTAHPLKPHNTTELIFVGDANDNWVHSVTAGRQTVPGPFKPTPVQIEEEMFGETLDAVLNGFGPQGISNGASDASPTNTEAQHWVSNCGPTAQSLVNGQLIGNSNPGEPTKGFPNGTWGPISHTYTTPGTHKICPVMYDPHGNRVGGNAGNPGQIIAGGQGHNGDNSVESNNNVNPCVVSTVVVPSEPKVFVGYVDEAANDRGSPGSHPTPWKGENGVTFVGCGFTGIDECPKSGGVDVYEAGAIRIDAPASSSIEITGASVTIGPCTYNPWPGIDRVVPAGGLIILTQTGAHKCTSTASEQDNFDTSESFLKSKQYEEFKAGGSKLGTCKSDGFIPEITLTINGQTTTVNDTTQTLNTGGIDQDICNAATETRGWTPIS